MAYNFSIFELLRVSGVLWLCVGLLFLFSPHAPLQALLFVGETIPRPSLSPFASAPFEHYVTPPGLKEQWPVYQMYARLIGVIAVVWSVVHVVLAMRLMQQQQSWDAFLVRRGKRGVKVGQAVEEYEDKEKNIQEEILPLGKGWTGMLHAVTHMQTIVSGTILTLPNWFPQFNSSWMNLPFMRSCCMLPVASAFVGIICMWALKRMKNKVQRAQMKEK